MKRRVLLALALLCGLLVAGDRDDSLSAQAERPLVLVVETSRGPFAIETFGREAPLTVAHIAGLATAGFYNGQRVHRALPGFLVQFGDPQTRELAKRSVWGRGPAASSGTPIGFAEINKRRLHLAGAVGVAHMGNPAEADSQIYITLARRPDLDGQYTVFGRIIEGQDIPALLEVGDEIRRVSVRP